MKNIFLMIAALVAFVLAACQTPVDYTVELPIIDYFDRPDSPDIGGIWIESWEAESTQSTISGNRLKLTGYSGITTGIYVENVKRFGDHELSLVFRGEHTNFLLQLTVNSMRGMDGGYIITFSETGYTIKVYTNFTAVSSSVQAFVYEKNQNYRLTITALGNLVGLLVVNSNSGASNTFSVSNNNPVGYDHVSVIGGYFVNGEASVTTVDDLVIVGK